MAEKDLILKEKIKYSGYCNFKDIYSYAYDWIKQEGYDIIEDEYREKVKGNSKDIEVSWKSSKAVSDYFKIEIDFKWRILDLEDVEVEIGGKKKKMNKVFDLGIDIKGTLVRDYDNKWNVSPTTKFFKELYNKYVIPSRTKDMKGKVASDVQEFKEEIKAFLDLTGKK